MIELTGSKVYPNHSLTSLLASSIPITLAPRQRTCESLLSTDLSTLKLSWAVTARMPLTLLAEMATPRPVPHIKTIVHRQQTVHQIHIRRFPVICSREVNGIEKFLRARSAFPCATISAAAIAKWGYAVLSDAELGPTSMTSLTRSSAFRSLIRVSLYAKPASSPPIAIRKAVMIVRVWE